MEAGEVKVGGEFKRGQHAVRRRPFKECASAQSGTTPWPPIVEINTQSGTGNWFRLPAGVVIVRRDARVWFSAEDLTQITDAQHSNMSLPEAYIRGVLRVRVTAGLEGDRAVGDPEVRRGELLPDGDVALAARASQADPQAQRPASAAAR